MRRKWDELNPTVIGQGEWAHQEPANLLLDKRFESCVEVAIAGGGDKFDPPPNGRSRSLQIGDHRARARAGSLKGADKRGKTRGSRQQFVQEPEPLGPKLRVH